MARLAMELTYTDSFERRDALSRKAVELVRGTGDRRALSMAMHSRQYAIQGPDTHDERMCLADEMVEIGRELGAPEVEAQGLVWRIRVQLELGARAEVDADIARHTALAAARPTALDRWLAKLFAAAQALLDGRLAEAERLALEAATTGAPLLDRPMPGDEELLQVTMVTRTRFGDVLGAVRVQLAEVWIEQGRGEELVAALKMSAEDLPLVPAWRCGLALLLARLGNGAEARAEIDQLVDGERVALPRDGLWMAGAAMLGEACAIVRDERAAAAVYDALVPYRDHNVVVGNAVSCQGSAERTLGLLAAALGRRDEAARHFEAALAFNARIGARVWTARTQHDYAAMLLERRDPGDRERAEALLAEAAAAADELGLVDIGHRVRRLGGVAV